MNQTDDIKGMCPPPWNLRGSAYIIIYKFPKKCRGERFFTADFAPGGDFSGFGAVMIVDYTESDAGPYRELLFSPGRFRHNGKKYHSITKIYVSTMESVENGRANWGIPKELADFSFSEHDGDRETVIVSRGDTKILEATFRRGRIALPVTTALMPVTLMQKVDTTLLFTRFLGKGRARLARLESISVNSDLFPDIARIKPLLAIRVDRFNLTFPVAKAEGESA